MQCRISDRADVRAAVAGRNHHQHARGHAIRDGAPNGAGIAVGVNGRSRHGRNELIRQRLDRRIRIGRGVRPGRNEVESVNRPIMCGGVLVRPGDVIVADGDGVIVVPREEAETVAKAARKILDSDKAERRELYQKLEMPLDKTVTP